jgi:2-oxoglutarate ferredoxin oxidoreductase subunit beta
MQTTTSPRGRSIELTGKPIHVCEMLSTLGGVAYLSRQSAHDTKHLLKTKKALKKAFEYQMAGLGFTMVEILCGCSINMRMKPDAVPDWVEKNRLPVFELGDYFDIKAQEEK